MAVRGFMVAAAYRPSDDRVVLIADNGVEAIPATLAKAVADAIYAALNARDVGKALQSERQA